MALYIPIEERYNCTSKRVRQMHHVWAATAAAVVTVAAGATTAAMSMSAADKARKELEWIESSVPPKADADYRSWQDQKLKFAAEMRKLISAMSDIAFKLFKAEEVNEILNIIDQEIGCESTECQQRIRDRIRRRRAVRFPIE